MRWKTLLAVMGILIIGFVAGFFTHRSMMEQRLKKLSGKRTAEAVEDRLLRLIEPEDEQLAQLKPVLEKYALRLSELGKAFHQSRLAVYDSLKAEVRPLLREEQIPQLEEAIDHMKRRRFSKKHRLAA
jgi:hypothetical protein